ACGVHQNGPAATQQRIEVRRVNDFGPGQCRGHLAMQRPHPIGLRFRHFSRGGAGENGKGYGHEATRNMRGGRFHQLPPVPRSKLCAKTALSLSCASIASLPLASAVTPKVIAGSAASEISLSRCSTFSPFKVTSR